MSVDSEYVLKRDGTNVETDNACAATSGTWVSPYDGGEWTAASDVDIDHMVPLSNAWNVSTVQSLAVLIRQHSPSRFSYLPPLLSLQTSTPANGTVRRLDLDNRQARGLRQRHRRAAALGRHRQRQPVKVGQGARRVDAAARELLVHVRAELDQGQERLGAERHGGGEGGAGGYAGVVLGVPGGC